MGMSAHDTQQPRYYQSSVSNSSCFDALSCSFPCAALNTLPLTHHHGMLPPPTPHPQSHNHTIPQTHSPHKVAGVPQLIFHHTALVDIQTLLVGRLLRLLLLLRLRLRLLGLLLTLLRLRLMMVLGVWLCVKGECGGRESVDSFVLLDVAVVMLCSFARCWHNSLSVCAACASLCAVAPHPRHTTPHQ